MENLGKKVGFLKGLMEGMSFDTESANGKLMAGIVGLLGDLSDRVEAIDELLEDLNDYVESIDEDLTELEGERDDDEDGLFDEEDDDDFDDMLFNNSEDKLHLLRPAQSEAPESEEDSLAGNLCPECHAMFVTSLNDPEGSEYVCPNCKKQIKPIPLNPENAVIAKPVEKKE
jgi:formylmethanofuran dehydrogenase subunit E